MTFSLSPTLATNERIQARIDAGHSIVHMAFGEAGLPVHPLLARALAEAASHNGYAPVMGTARARRAVAGYFERRGLPTDPDLVVLAPGSKPLLFALLRALPGDVLLPSPSWVSYEAQAALVGTRVIRVPIPRETGGIPDADALEQRIAQARRQGQQPAVLVVTMPDNPTGTVAPRSSLERVCAVAANAGLTVVSDEIYRDLTFDQGSFTSPAALYPEGTVVTAGLSKNLALGGWRIGFARLPHTPAGWELREAISGIASEIWSCLAAPMQEVAALGLDEPEELRLHIEASRRLHATVARAVHSIFVEAGATCRSPQAAFYLYPDFEPLRDRLETMGVSGGVELAELLLERYDIAVLAGAAFGDDPRALRFRVSTSLLYGSTPEQRWQALDAADPLALPWVAESLEEIRDALGAVSGQRPNRPERRSPVV